MISQDRVKLLNTNTEKYHPRTTEPIKFLPQPPTYYKTRNKTNRLQKFINHFKTK